MQIHELNNFAGTPTSSDYLAIDNSTTTTKIGATALGVQDKLTVAEANTGTSTASRIVTPKVVHDYVTGEIDDITSSATESKWATITGNDGSINDALDYVADKISLIGKELTMSNTSWTSGSCTVTDSAKYRMFIIWAGTPCIGIRYEDHLYAFSIAGGASAVYTRAFDCTVSGDIWTLANIIQLGHTASSNHGSKVTPTITKVIGLIPFTN